jgi:hypothetical protein
MSVSMHPNTLKYLILKYFHKPKYYLNTQKYFDAKQGLIISKKEISLPPSLRQGISTRKQYFSYCGIRFSKTSGMDGYMQSGRENSSNRFNSISSACHNMLMNHEFIWSSGHHPQTLKKWVAIYHELRRGMYWNLEVFLFCFLNDSMLLVWS